MDYIKSKLLAVVSVLLLSSVVFGVWQYIKALQYKNQVTVLESALLQKQSQIAALEYNLQTCKTTCQAEIESLEMRNTIYRAVDDAENTALEALKEEKVYADTNNTQKSSPRASNSVSDTYFRLLNKHCDSVKGSPCKNP